MTFENHLGLKFRPNVAAILQDVQGRVLICERLNVDGSWQFPQGGVDKGETPEQALERELAEELSLPAKDYRVLTSKGPYRYAFGNGRKKKGFDGQEQTYFLAQFTGSAARIEVRTKHQEFQAVRWISPSEFDLQWLPVFKHDVYRAVLRDFFEILK